jgi:4a-hydroxytetrahydrobiopterin dehydratase
MLDRHCKPCPPGTPPLSAGQISEMLKPLEGWSLKDKQIVRALSFTDFYETMGFVNAVAYIANREDHHPDMEVGYNKCTVRFSTHSVGGLSENDFICAAKVNALLS